MNYDTEIDLTFRLNLEVEASSDAEARDLAEKQISSAEPKELHALVDEVLKDSPTQKAVEVKAVAPDRVQRLESELRSAVAAHFPEPQARVSLSELADKSFLFTVVLDDGPVTHTYGPVELEAGFAIAETIGDFAQAMDHQIGRVERDLRNEHRGHHDLVGQFDSKLKDMYAGTAEVSATLSDLNGRDLMAFELRVDQPDIGTSYSFERVLDGKALEALADRFDDLAHLILDDHSLREALQLDPTQNSEATVDARQAGEALRTELARLDPSTLNRTDLSVLEIIDPVSEVSHFSVDVRTKDAAATAAFSSVVPKAEFDAAELAVQAVPGTALDLVTEFQTHLRNLVGHQFDVSVALDSPPSDIMNIHFVREGFDREYSANIDALTEFELSSGELLSTVSNDLSADVLLSHLENVYGADVPFSVDFSWDLRGNLEKPWTVSVIAELDGQKYEYENRVADLSFNKAEEVLRIDQQLGLSSLLSKSHGQDMGLSL